MELEEEYDDVGREASAENVRMSAIEFSLDPASGVPTYLQLVQQVEQAAGLDLSKQAISFRR